MVTFFLAAFSQVERLNKLQLGVARAMERIDRTHNALKVTTQVLRHKQEELNELIRTDQLDQEVDRLKDPSSKVRRWWLFHAT